MCTSVTGAFTIMGVSTSMRPRSTKKCRACISTAERCANRSRVAVGLHSTMMLPHPVPDPGQCLSHANAILRVQFGQPVDGVRWQDQDDGRAHVEAAHFGP